MKVISFEGTNEMLLSVDIFSGKVDFENGNHEMPGIIEMPVLASKYNKTIVLQLNDEEIERLKANKQLIMSFIPHYQTDDQNRKIAVVPNIHIL